MSYEYEDNDEDLAAIKRARLIIQEGVREMQPEILAAWIQALESGEYDQGRKVLRSTDNKYCCLGVVCDIVAGDEWYEKELASVRTPRLFHPYGNIDAGLLDNEACAQLRLSTIGMDTFAEVNDNGWTFAEIADAMKSDDREDDDA